MAGADASALTGAAMVLETCVETCVSLVAWLRRRRSSTSTLTVSSNILRSTFDNDASLEKRLNISSGTMWHTQHIEYSPLDSHPDTGTNLKVRINISPQGSGINPIYLYAGSPGGSEVSSFAGLSRGSGAVTSPKLTPSVRLQTFMREPCSMRAFHFSRF